MQMIDDYIAELLIALNRQEQFPDELKNLIRKREYEIRLELMNNIYKKITKIIYSFNEKDDYSAIISVCDYVIKDLKKHIKELENK